LLSSEKDRAELVMIVDLERNDLGRICRTGTVRVDPGIGLRSFPAVHHLVACVSGELLPDVGWLDLLAAAFPGGSVTGAPKRRAVRILQELEPVDRGYFTGSLFWFGDDGSMDSSILIRTATFTRQRAWLGAGGGVVADSDPEREWQESNDKARAPAEALGFVPEQAE
jgi:para-aminobenzoate synthetase component 1